MLLLCRGNFWVFYLSKMLIFPFFLGWIFEENGILSFIYLHISTSNFKDCCIRSLGCINKKGRWSQGCDVLIFGSDGPIMKEEKKKSVRCMKASKQLTLSRISYRPTAQPADREWEDAPVWIWKKKENLEELYSFWWVSVELTVTLFFVLSSLCSLLTFPISSVVQEVYSEIETLTKDREI